jgi:hypothetical protein
MNERFLPETTAMLREAGWFPGRDVSNDLQLPPDFTLFPAALAVLKEFGLLHVGQGGPGVEMARTTLDLDPMLAIYENDTFSDYEKDIQAKLYPLGEAEHGHAFLAIDERGQVYLLFGKVYWISETFDAALDNLLNGLKRARPITRPIPEAAEHTD